MIVLWFKKDLQNYYKVPFFQQESKKLILRLSERFLGAQIKEFFFSSLNIVAANPYISYYPAQAQP